MYIQWDAENQTHVGFPCNVPGTYGTWLKCTQPATERVSEAQTLKWHYLEGIHEDYLVGYWEGSADPLDAPAYPNQIQVWYDTGRSAPIEACGIMVDCDEESERLMQGALDTWMDRPLDNDWFKEINVDGTFVRVLDWRCADNVRRTCTREQLSAIFEAMTVNRAVRVQELWARYQRYKRDGCTLRDLS